MATEGAWGEGSLIPEDQQQGWIEQAGEWVVSQFSGETYTECPEEPPHDQVALMMNRIAGTADEARLADLHDKANPNFPPQYHDGLEPGQLAFRAVGGRDCQVNKHHDFARYFQQMMDRYVYRWSASGQGTQDWGHDSGQGWSDGGHTVPPQGSSSSGGTTAAGIASGLPAWAQVGIALGLVLLIAAAVGR